MRHSQRHMRKAVSTVLGLTAPALAALLLTSSVPSTAASAPAAVEASDVLHGPVLVPLAAAPTAKTVVVAKPTAKAVAKPVARRTAVVTPTVRRTVAVKPAVRTTTTTTSTTSQTSQPRGTDDYPYRTAAGNPTDKWGFTQRQCVSFAAWRLAQHGRTISNTDNWGSAYSWDEAARRLGFAVSTKARVGAIAQWNVGESSPYYAPGSSKANGSFAAGGYGHVGWVKMVYSDGSALVEQYNMGGDRSYSVMRVKAPRYLAV